MTKQNNYQTLIDDHTQLMRFGRKLGLSGGVMQFSFLVFITAWKHLEIPYYKIVAPILVSWCLYQFVKDFFTLLKVDGYSSKILSDGIAEEKRNTTFGRYFHNAVDKFNLQKILIQRSLINFIAFGCLGYFLSQFLIELSPALNVSLGWIIMISLILTAFAYKLYHISLEPIEKIKSLQLKAGGS